MDAHAFAQIDHLDCVVAQRADEQAFARNIDCEMIDAAFRPGIAIVRTKLSGATPPTDIVLNPLTRSKTAIRITCMAVPKVPTVAEKNKPGRKTKQPEPPLFDCSAADFAVENYR